MSLQQLAKNLVFGGSLTKYKVDKTDSLGGLAAQFNVFLPAEADSSKVPVLYYLAGLTCTEDTGAQKGGFLRDAAAEGIAVVFPDTSPRGAGIEGEEEDWDFGTGAGFYLDATSDKYRKHYNMYSFVTAELPKLLSSLPIDTAKASIFGHSMGGMGALTLYLKSLTSPSPFLSASAFAPISNPTLAPWGEKAYKGYLAGGVEEGKQWDPTELIKANSGKDLNILIDAGTGDDFYKKAQILPENLQAAATAAGLGEDKVKVNLRDGYDHSYWFIQTFAPAHIKFHAKFLKA